MNLRYPGNLRESSRISGIFRDIWGSLRIIGNRLRSLAISEDLWGSSGISNGALDHSEISEDLWASVVLKNLLI